MWVAPGAKRGAVRSTEMLRNGAWTIASAMLLAAGTALAAETFTSIDFPSASFTAVMGINPQGDIVGRYISGGVEHGFLLSGGQFTSIDVPGASLTDAWRINPRGDIVGQYTAA